MCTLCSSEAYLIIPKCVFIYFGPFSFINIEFLVILSILKFLGEAGEIY